MTQTITWPQLRRALDRIASAEGNWAGMPMPVEEAPLVVAPKYPGYEAIHGATLSEEKPEPDEKDYEFVNEWYGKKWKCYVSIIRHKPTGKIEWGFIPADTHRKRVSAKLKMLGISLTMDVESERRAMQTLRGLIKPHLANAYELVGWFIETSEKSGVTYLFRRLGPTIAFRMRDDTSYNYLASLCLHPIAYYDGLPMGAMVPTDDVIAHLVMMRTDEHLFWRKSNQHGPTSPGANL